MLSRRCAFDIGPSRRTLLAVGIRLGVTHGIALRPAAVIAGKDKISLGDEHGTPTSLPSEVPRRRSDSVSIASLKMLASTHTLLTIHRRPVAASVAIKNSAGTSPLAGGTTSRRSRLVVLAEEIQ